MSWDRSLWWIYSRDVISRAPLGAVFTPIGRDAGQPRRCAAQDYDPGASIGNGRGLIRTRIPDPGPGPLGLFALALCPPQQRDPSEKSLQPLSGCSQHRLQPLNCFPSPSCWDAKRNRVGQGWRFQGLDYHTATSPFSQPRSQCNLPVTPTDPFSACLPPGNSGNHLNTFTWCLPKRLPGSLSHPCLTKTPIFIF